MTAWITVVDWKWLGSLFPKQKQDKPTSHSGIIFTFSQQIKVSHPGCHFYSSGEAVKVCSVESHTQTSEVSAYTKHPSNAPPALEQLHT